MPRRFECPFWKCEEKLVAYCEGGKLTFASKEEKTAYFDRYCAECDGWRNCSIAKSLNDSYDKGIRH